MTGESSPLPWPPPAPTAPDAAENPPAWRCRALAWLAVACGLAGGIGALLPALAGQRVGDPDTAVFWIGIALGIGGSTAAIGLSVIALARGGGTSFTRAIVTIALVLGCIAGFLTAALFLSG